MTMDVRGTTEIVSWVLGFGDKARVVAPRALTEAVSAELRRAATAPRKS
jgi:predicted DNA-binding transcriptional regulator YafY